MSHLVFNQPEQSKEDHGTQEKHKVDVVESIAESLCSIVQMTPNALFREKALETYRVSSVTALQDEMTVKLNEILEKSRKKNRKTKPAAPQESASQSLNPEDDFSPIKKKVAGPSQQFSQTSETLDEFSDPEMCEDSKGENRDFSDEEHI